MDTSRSDAYYLAQLTDKLKKLEADLSKKLSPEADLTLRCRQLSKELHQVLRNGDEQAMAALEFALLPKIHRFLGDARDALGRLKMLSSKP